MKVLKLLIEGQKVIDGTNCFNCKFGDTGNSHKVEKDELDPQGGLKMTDKKILKIAADADLVTLPGKETVTEKFKCTHPKVKLNVTKRMCCAFWDADGILRAFGKKVVGK